MSFKIEAEKREETGKYNNLVLRDGGKIPGSVTSKEKGNLNISLLTKEVEKALLRNQKDIDLTVGSEVHELKIVEVQYRVASDIPIHVDFVYRS